MGRSEDKMSVDQLTGLYMQLMQDVSEGGALREKYAGQVDAALESPEVKEKLSEARRSLTDNKVPTKEIDQAMETLKKQLPDMAVDRMALVTKVVHQEIAKQDPDLAKSFLDEHPEVAEKLESVGPKMAKELQTIIEQNPGAAAELEKYGIRADDPNLAEKIMNQPLPQEALDKLKDFKIPQARVEEVRQNIKEYLNSDEANLNKLIQKELTSTVTEAVDGFDDTLKAEYDRRMDRQMENIKAAYPKAVQDMAQTLFDGQVTVGEDGVGTFNQNGRAALQAAADGLKASGGFGEQVAGALEQKLQEVGLSLKDEAAAPSAAPAAMSSP